MKRALFPFLALSALAALAYYLPKVVQQTEGFAPLADSMAKDVAAERPPAQDPPPPLPQESASASVLESAAAYEPAPVMVEAPDLTPFIEAMAAGDHAKAGAYLDLIKAKLPAEKVASLTASVATSRQREEAAAKAEIEAKAAALAAEKAAMVKPAASATDAAVVDSLRQLQQAQQETAKMLTELNAKQKAPAVAALAPATVGTNLSVKVPTTVEPLPGTTVVRFSRDSSVIDNAEGDKLAPVLTALKSDSAARIELRGFADKSGNSDYNLSLSRARASAVQDIFRRAGIPSTRISVQSMGSFQATADLSPEKAAEMRKVEVILVK
jgi:outer membrane protein OmpA-like peptidoglycan-associated protein